MIYLHCQKFSLSGLYASVYKSLNVQSYKWVWVRWDRNLLYEHRSSFERGSDTFLLVLHNTASPNILSSSEIFNFWRNQCHYVHLDFCNIFLFLALVQHSAQIHWLCIIIRHWLRLASTTFSLYSTLVQTLLKWRRFTAVLHSRHQCFLFCPL